MGTVMGIIIMIACALIGAMIGIIVAGLTD